MKRMVFSDDEASESSLPQTEFEPLRVGVPSRVERYRALLTSRNLLNGVLLLIICSIAMEHGFSLSATVEIVAALVLLVNNSKCMYVL